MVKAPEVLARQMRRRGWTPADVDEARRLGARFVAVNMETGGSATRYVHPRTRRSVVIDDASGEIIHVGGDGFLY